MGAEGRVQRELETNDSAAAVDALELAAQSGQAEELGNGRSPRLTRNILMQALMPGAGGGGIHAQASTAPPLLPTLPRGVENSSSSIPNSSNAPEGFANVGRPEQ